MKTIIVLGRWVEHGSNFSNFLFYMLVVRGLTVYQSVDCSVERMERTCIYMIHMSIANKAELVGGLEHEWIIDDYCPFQTWGPSSQPPLTNSRTIIFDGEIAPPTRILLTIINHINNHHH